MRMRLRACQRLDGDLDACTACSHPSKLDLFDLEFSVKISRLREERTHVKASKFTEAQKSFILKQGEQGTSIAKICRKAGISQATYFNWKKKYGGLLPDEIR